MLTALQLFQNRPGGIKDLVLALGRIFALNTAGWSQLSRLCLQPCAP